MPDVEVRPAAVERQVVGVNGPRLTVRELVAPERARLIVGGLAVRVRQLRAERGADLRLKAEDAGVVERLAVRDFHPDVREVRIAALWCADGREPRSVRRQRKRRVQVGLAPQVNAMRAHVTGGHDQLRREGALDIHVVLLDVGALRVELNREGVDQPLAAREQRVDVRERRVGDPHLLEEGLVLERHVAVGRVEHRVVVEAGTAADRRRVLAAGQFRDPAPFPAGRIREPDARREVLQRRIAEQRIAERRRRIHDVAHVGDLAVDLVRRRHELVAEPEIQREIVRRAPVVLAVEAEQPLRVMTIRIVLARRQAREVARAPPQKVGEGVDGELAAVA